MAEEKAANPSKDNDSKKEKLQKDLQVEPQAEIGYIKPRKIEDEMQESYLDYAMSVIVARALPDVRDGLKPVHRRILYAMHRLGLTKQSKYRKSATVVGEVLGKYHPHGDVAVYDSLVRMAQDFNMRYALIDGQGNFGSIDGDPAAAMRYTECRMAGITSEMLFDIDKDTIDFMDNYDGSQKEPTVLPAKLPNLLLNGTLGIAVGMATNIPPHNLGELCDGITYLIDNPDAPVDELMNFIKGPDFPTKGVIFNAEEIKVAYATGKGSIPMRAVANIEEDKKNFRIIITELPYQVNKATLLEKIAELVKLKKIVGLSDLRDESDQRGMRVVIDLKRDAYPQKILNQLFKFTPMQQTFHVNMLSLVDGIEPRVLTLKMMLEQYIKHRKEVVERRARFELAQAKARAHILEGFKKALDHINEVIKTIKQSKDKEQAKVNLMKKFKFSDLQTDAILEMRLHQLAALERQKIEDEYQEKLKLIKYLEALLKSPKKIFGVIKDELAEIKDKYADERKTKIVKGKIGDFSDTDLIPNEEVVVTITKGNYIKRIPISTYKIQGRGGKGVVGVTPKEEDIVEHLFTTMTHDDIWFFTNQGRVFQLKVYEIPVGSRIAKGQAIVNLLNTAPNESVTAALTSDVIKKYKYIFMFTKNGLIKKTKISEFENIRKSGLIAIRLRDDDELKWVKGSSGEDEAIIVSAEGQSIRFSEKDARPLGRGTIGVRGIKLRKGDQVVGADVVLKENKGKSEILVIGENGYGKRTQLKNYHVQHRGGIGIKTSKVTPKTGKIIHGCIVDDRISDAILVSTQGQIIRLPYKSIPSLGRSTQGVILMRMKDNHKVASLTCVSESSVEVQKGPEKVAEQKKSISEPVKEPEKMYNKTKEAKIQKPVKELQKVAKKPKISTKKVSPKPKLKPKVKPKIKSKTKPKRNSKKVSPKKPAKSKANKKIKAKPRKIKK